MSPSVKSREVVGDWGHDGAAVTTIENVGVWKLSRWPLYAWDKEVARIKEVYKSSCIRMKRDHHQINTHHIILTINFISLCYFLFLVLCYFFIFIIDLQVMYELISWLIQVQLLFQFLLIDFAQGLAPMSHLSSPFVKG